jgi:hypothetical protein
MTYFNKAWIPRQVFEKKNLKYQISSKSGQGAPSHAMRTDGYDEADSRFSQFFECA